ncbi:MAG: ABC-F family ATP-binding cassette domain-containing protein [Bacteroidales bacterium]|nr:ABC-F family ATP-binding cassette domain-containing protein [Bacteroidales bacterium]
MISYLQVENISKAYGENVLFENISFSLHKDEKVALIAKNGSGKTTLLNIIVGKDTPDEGKISMQKNLSIAYLPQNPVFEENNTVLEQVLRSTSQLTEIINFYHKAIESGDEKLIQKATEQMDIASAWDVDQKIIEILTKLNISQVQQKIKYLSGGERRRVALAAALIETSDVLILDEPTNHLDLQMIEWLELYLKSRSGTLFMVTHDRYFMENVCSAIIEIEDNTVYQYKGNYQYYLEKREARLKEMQANIDKASNLYRKELDWMRRMPQARATKAKSRIENFYKVKEQASKRIDNSTQVIDIQSKRLGKKILEIENISKQFDNKVLIKEFSYKFGRAQKIGIVGPNGAGKSTFLNIITGILKPDSGTIEIGETIHFGYYHQQGIKLDEDKRMIEVIKEIAEVMTVGKDKTLSAAQLLEYFRFDKEKHYSYVSKLSGGERKRLYLLTILMKNPNFLILDEPTNDFDIQTLNVLEDYLNNFPGNVIIVSHDRYFMDKVIDELFIFDEAGKIKSFPGNYTDYQDYIEFQDKEKQKQLKVSVSRPDKKPVEKKKFGFKEKREFELLEKEIEDLNQEKLELETLMNSGNLSNDELHEKSNRYSEILEIIDEKEMRWLELSELQE